MTKPVRFTGFSPGIFRFFDDLEDNNNKLWFEENRSRYETHLLGPMRDLVSDLGSCMLDIDPEFEMRPAINKTISRIYRDTRFSKDKTPYRCSIWLCFKRPGKDWAIGQCAYFFEIMPNEYRFGMGFYDAAPKIMATMRAMIDEHPDRFLQLAEPLRRQRTFELWGEVYKRSKEPSTSDEASMSIINKPVVQDWYQRKTIALISTRKPDETLYTGRLVKRLADSFLMLAPCYHFLCDAIKRSRIA